MSLLWSQRTPGEKRLLILCLIIILVAVWLSLTPPAGAGKKLLSTADARQKYTEMIRQMQTLEDETGRLKPAIEKMTFQDRPEALLPKAIRTLQKHAKASGLHLREIKPLRARRLATVTRVPLSVRFTTTEFRKSVIPFLYRVEDPAGRMVVEKCSVTAADPKTRAIDVEVQIALYTQKEEEKPEGI
jgi:type II secretory pathway component PulM